VPLPNSCWHRNQIRVGRIGRHTDTAWIAGDNPEKVMLSDSTQTNVDMVTLLILAVFYSLFGEVHAAQECLKSGTGQKTVESRIYLQPLDSSIVLNVASL
jgi:hypothetical protein